MIVGAETLDAPAPRLLAAVGERSGSRPATHVLGAGSAVPARDQPLAPPGARLLVMSALGVHPDARAPRLRALWELEERARATGQPVLVLRLAPILGPSSPLWLRLRSRPAMPEAGHLLLSPVVESDVVDTLARALEGRAAWEGWFEVVGPEPFALEELVALAARAPRAPQGAGAWEPPPAEWREHRLAETGPWSEHFGLTPTLVSIQAESWS